MKLLRMTILGCLSIITFATGTLAQTIANDASGLKEVSTAPVSYRVNVVKAQLHGYYKKGYNLNIYGDADAIGFRADCDEDNDWTGAKVEGTTQKTNAFEPKFKCAFDPYKLYGTVLPGNRKGQNHYDGTDKLGAVVGDLTITYRLDKAGNAVDSVIAVVFDRGPNNQPGESSVKTAKKFKQNLDNNQFIYIIFPNTAQYLMQVIGTKPNSTALNRNPTNADFEQAYTLMNSQSSAVARKAKKQALVSALSPIAVLNNFDNATPAERTKSLNLSSNNDRNLNQ